MGRSALTAGLGRIASLCAFAKVNLGLRILNRRPDGFHELRTVFHTISLADLIQLSFTPAAVTSIEVEGMPDVADNLVTKAAKAVLEELSVTANIHISIEKQIPMGAGLGGGSSDAAAILLALPALAGQVIPMNRLLSLAAPLGSDVPFFLLGGAALGIGRGEELYSLPEYPELPGILIAPGIHVSTPDAYRALSPTLPDPQEKLLAFQQSVREPLSHPLINDFEPVVFAHHPSLESLKRRLLEQGATQALMSGSGSSIFGLFNSKETLPGVVQSEGGSRSFRISLVSRSRYRSQWIKSLAPHIEPELWPPQSLYAP